MPQRRDIVARVLDLARSDITVDQAEKIWFYDLRRTGGLRLTRLGFDAMTRAGLQHWPISIDWSRMTKRTILEMNRRIEWPYYIRPKPPELILFSDREAVMASLYGDISRWLSSIVDQQRR